jgi:hypothetical protein
MREGYNSIVSASKLVLAELSPSMHQTADHIRVFPADSKKSNLLRRRRYISYRRTAAAAGVLFMNKEPSQIQEPDLDPPFPVLKDYHEIADALHPRPWSPRADHNL